jgi:1-acyl-sn-glycerol-3-phosphate acyltransferase
VIGREHLPKGGALICSNHTRNSDPLFIAFALKRSTELRIMAKEEMTRWPIVGPLLSRADLMIWVKRGKADIGAVKGALKSLKEGRKLLIFPQGTRSEEIGEGKTGAAMIAIRSGVPIVPVYLPAKKCWFRRTPIVIGEAYQPFTEDRKPTLEDYRTVTEDLMERIAKLEEQTK